MIERQALKELADFAVEQWPERADGYYSGEEAVVGFFVGAIMRAADGRASLFVLREVVLEALEEHRP